MSNRFLAGLMSVLLCSCTANLTQDDPGKSWKLVEMTLNAISGKTSMQQDGTVVWNPGDRISVFDEAGNHEFITEKGGVTASFKGTALADPEIVYMLYPYDANAVADLKNGKIKTLVPAVQTGVKGSFGKAVNVTAAIVRNRTFFALNTCGLLKLTLTRGDVVSVDIVSCSKESSLAGRAVISMDAEGAPAVCVEAGSPSVSLNGGGSVLSPGEYYLDVVPGKLSGGYEVRLLLSDGSVSIVKYETPITVVTSGCTDIGNVDGRLNILSEKISIPFVNHSTGALNQPFASNIPGSLTQGPVTYSLQAFGRTLDFTIGSESGYCLFKSDWRAGLDLTEDLTGAFIQLPAIPGKALRAVSLASGTTTQSFMRYRIVKDLSSQSVDSPLAYLDLYGGMVPSPVGTIVDGEAGRSYYLYVRSNPNATLDCIELTYESVDSGVGEKGPYMVPARSQYRGDKSWTMYNESWTVDDLPGFCPVGNPDVNDYGGWKCGFSFNATGWFHCEKRGNRWWMVDPEGCPFISAGISTFKLYTRNQPFKDAYAAKYGSDEQKWAIGEWRKLKSYGFNSFGAFCDEPVITRNLKVPYILTLNPMDDYLLTIKDGCIAKYGASAWKEEGPFGFPMVFDEGFTEYCRSVAANAAVKGYASDPYLMGTMTDNEFPVNLNFLKICYEWPDKEHPNYLEAVKWLKDNNLEYSNAVASIDKRRKFAAYCYETYLRKVSSALKAYLPNHMYMGTKETGANYETALLNNYTFDVAGKYVDAFSLDFYSNWAPRPEILKDWSRRCGKPIVIAEWYVKGEDVSLAQPDIYTNTDGVGWTVPTQKDRGLYYQNFVLKCLESGVVVGWHWFKYCDGHPAEKIAGSGYYSSDNCNKGVESISMEPYTDCLEQMKKLNDQIFPLCSYYETNL